MMAPLNFKIADSRSKTMEILFEFPDTYEQSEKTANISNTPGHRTTRAMKGAKITIRQRSRGLKRQRASPGVGRLPGWLA